MIVDVGPFVEEINFMCNQFYDLCKMSNKKDIYVWKQMKGIYKRSNLVCKRQS